MPLPLAFPYRDLIALSVFFDLLGTLVLRAVVLTDDDPIGCEMTRRVGSDRVAASTLTVVVASHCDTLFRMRLLVWLVSVALQAMALERPGVEFKIFQFPPDQIPRIDGKADDWAIVPERFAIGTDQLRDTVNNTPADAKDLDVKVKVGWVKGLNRLYFLYEAYDNYWDFKSNGLHNDIFELVVDGDLSGGPFIKQMHPMKGYDPVEAHFTFTAFMHRTTTSSLPPMARIGLWFGAVSPGSKTCPMPIKLIAMTSNTANAGNCCSNFTLHRSIMQLTKVRNGP